MLNRDELAALARGAVTLIAGAAILYAVGRWLGWYWVGAIFVSGVGAALWDMRRWPRIWRPW